MGVSSSRYLLEPGTFAFCLANKVVHANSFIEDPFRCEQRSGTLDASDCEFCGQLYRNSEIFGWACGKVKELSLSLSLSIILQVQAGQ